MKILDHPAVIALGAATLSILPLVAPLVSPSHLDVYHLSSSALAIYLPVIMNVGILWTFFTGLFWIAQRPGPPRIAIWSSIMLFLPWILLKSFATLTLLPLRHWISLGIFASSLIALIALLFLWRPSFRPVFENARGFVATLLAFTSLCGVVFCVQLLWFAWQARALNTPRPLHQPDIRSASKTPKPRIIWIVLDELSYQQLYKQRFPGLQLPAFDQLASESTIFTHVIPAGIFTHNVIPSLMTGLPIDRIRSSADGQLLLHNTVSDTWQRFDPYATIFQDALNNGYSTAIAGWYNPYCRIMPQVLDHCFWISHLPLPSGFVADQSFTANLLQPARDFVSLARSFVLQKRRTPRNILRDNKLHADDYHDLFRAADDLLTNSSITFMFLHMPVPHPGGIYDRRTSTFATSNSSYIDNLALADSYLAHVHQVLQRQGQWDSSTIVVMGDHSWRTKLFWSSSTMWTAEDQSASHGGQFDDRPAYIVKLPQQQRSAHIDAPFAATRTRSLLEAIFSNQIKSSDDLAVWVRQQNLSPALSH